MLDTFFCGDCGRLLCEAHRSLHTCERHDAEKQRKASMTYEQVQQEVREKELQKEQAAAEAEAERQTIAEQKATTYLMMKERRKTLASKSTHIANFIQQMSLRDGVVGSVQAELLEAYTSASRINLRLWNEYETPSERGALANDEWQRLCALYTRACEVRFTATPTADVTRISGYTVDER